MHKYPAADFANKILNQSSAGLCSGLLKHIFFNLQVCRLAALVLYQFLHVYINVDMRYRISQNQETNALHMRKHFEYVYEYCLLIRFQF